MFAAIAPLVMAAVSAAASAASGIAGAASQADAARVNAGESEKDRKLREKLQAEQLAEQERQFQLGQSGLANSALQSQLAHGAEQTTSLAAERAQSRDDLRGNLSRAYLRSK